STAGDRDGATSRPPAAGPGRSLAPPTTSATHRWCRDSSRPTQPSQTPSLKRWILPIVWYNFNGMDTVVEPPAGEARGVKRIAVLGGGGLMGHGIALACLTGSDCEVTIISSRAETVERGLDLVVNGPFGLERAVARGKLAADTAAAARDRLRGTTDVIEGLDGADRLRVRPRG